jgi:hypothetical protein
MPRTDLDARVHDALTRLPAPVAPSTLLPRVMAAVQRRPWYARAWTTWPLPLRIASAVGLAGLAVGVALAWPLVDAASRLLMARVAASLQPVSRASEGATEIFMAIDVLRRVFAPALGFAVVVVTVMSAACAVVGAALARFALGGASQS